MNIKALSMRRKYARQGYFQDDGIDMLKGLAAGAIGGLVGSWVMSRMHAATAKASHWMSGEGEDYQSGQSPFIEETGGHSHERGDYGEERTSVQAATMVSRRLFRRELSERGRRWAVPAVRYGYGTTIGGIYGAFAQAMPICRTGMGLPLGAVMWLISDEIALPALKMKRRPTQVPVREHAAALASHLAFGATVDGVRRLMLRLLDAEGHERPEWMSDWSSRLSRQTRRIGRRGSKLGQRYARYGRRVFESAKRPSRLWAGSC